MERDEGVVIMILVQQGMGVYGRTLWDVRVGEMLALELTRDEALWTVACFLVGADYPAWMKTAAGALEQERRHWDRREGCGDLTSEEAAERDAALASVRARIRALGFECPEPGVAAVESGVALQPAQEGGL